MYIYIYLFIFIIKSWYHGFLWLFFCHPSLLAINLGHLDSAQCPHRLVYEWEFTKLLISSPQLFQHCCTCLIRLIWIVCEKGVNWQFSCFFVCFFLVGGSVACRIFSNQHVISLYSPYLNKYLRLWRELTFRA